MNFDQAVRKACEEPTLVDALSWIAVWESERAIQQARRFFETGKSTTGTDRGWDTCFKFCFERVLAEYPEAAEGSKSWASTTLERAALIDTLRRLQAAALQGNI